MSKPRFLGPWIAMSCFLVASACAQNTADLRAAASADRASVQLAGPMPSSPIAELRTVDEFAPIGNPRDRPTGVSAGVLSQPASTAIRAARAELQPLDNSGVSGVIEFAQDDGQVTVIGKIDGLQPGEHGFHIHQNGDCTAPDGSSAGAHFAPDDRPHGARDAPEAQRHVGDLGNVDAAADGTANVSITDTLIRLDGPNSVVGRAVIVHANADDLSSQPSGNAGSRIACGVVREVIIEKTVSSVPVALR